MTSRFTAALLICLATLLVGCQAGSETSSSDPAAPADQSSNLTLVTLTVPNMTWGGCAASVRGDLAKLEGVSDIETDIASRTASFRLANPDFDYRGALTELAASNPHLAEFSIQ